MAVDALSLASSLQGLALLDQALVLLAGHFRHGGFVGSYETHTHTHTHTQTPDPIPDVNVFAYVRHRWETV